MLSSEDNTRSGLLKKKIIHFFMSNGDATIADVCKVMNLSIPTVTKLIMDLQEDGRFKMNPPIRSKEDRLALIEGIKDGTVDMIATDHAPHSAEEKGRGLEKSLMGVVGLETAFPVLYTELVTKNIITLDRLVELMSVKPKERFGIDTNNDFAVFDISEAYKIDPEDFLSMGRATPFAGREVFGRCLLTVHNGKVVYKAEERA